jgi:hypothetical protein
MSSPRSCLTAVAVLAAVASVSSVYTGSGPADIQFTPPTPRCTGAEEYTWSVQSKSTCTTNECTMIDRTAPHHAMRLDVALPPTRARMRYNDMRACGHERMANAIPEHVIDRGVEIRSLGYTVACIHTHENHAHCTSSVQRSDGALVTGTFWSHAAEHIACVLFFRWCSSTRCAPLFVCPTRADDVTACTRDSNVTPSYACVSLWPA